MDNASSPARSRAGGFIIDGRVLFDAQTGRLTSLAVPDQQVELDPVAARVLLRFVTEPQTVIIPERLIEPSWQDHDVQPSIRGAVHIIRELRRALLQVEPTAACLCILPRLGFALVASVVPADQHDT